MKSLEKSNLTKITSLRDLDNHILTELTLLLQERKEQYPNILSWLTNIVIPDIGKSLEIIVCRDPDDGVIKGACIYEPKRMYIHTFYISEKLRGKGNGRAMMFVLDTIGKMWTVSIADSYLDECKGFWEKFRFEFKYSVTTTTKTSSVYARY